MKRIVAIVAFACTSSMAQTSIYRCGNEYVNDAEKAAKDGCKEIAGEPSSRRGVTAADSGAKPAATENGTHPSWAQKEPPPQAPKRDQNEFGLIDKWRFESCMQDAAKMPTEAGVRVAASSCLRKFGQ